MNKKVKVMVLVSGLWLFFWVVAFIAEFPIEHHTWDPPGKNKYELRLEYTARHLLFLLPLVLGWGIWWVRKPDK